MNDRVRRMRDRLARNRGSPDAAAAPPGAASVPLLNASVVTPLQLPSPAPGPASAPTPPSASPTAALTQPAASLPTASAAAAPTAASSAGAAPVGAAHVQPVAPAGALLRSPDAAVSAAAVTASTPLPVALRTRRGVLAPSASAAGDALDKFPQVDCYFVERDDDELAEKACMDAYLATDIYLKKSSPGLRPCTPTDFQGCKNPILLKRLPDGSTASDVERAVALYKPEADCFDGRALRIRGVVREESKSKTGGRDASRTSVRDFVLVFPVGSAKLCASWVDALRSRVEPLALRRDQVLNIFRRSCPPNAASVLEELRLMYEKEERDQVGECGGDAGSADDVSHAARTVERSEACMRRLARVSEKIDLAKSTAEGIVNVISGSEVADVVARVLGGAGIVGSVINLASMCICIAKLVAQAQDDRNALGDLCERVPAVAHRLSQCLFGILRASCSSDGQTEIVVATFEAIEKCWQLFNEAERYLFRKKRAQFWLSEHAGKMKYAADELETSLRFALRDENISHLSIRTTVNEEKISEISDGLNDVRVAIADCGPSEDQVERAVLAPPAPAHVVREAIPDYDAIRASLLSGSTTSLSDASRAQEQEGAGQEEPVESAQQKETDFLPTLAVDGDGGYGKTTCLLLLANDPLLQREFKYVIFIAFGLNVQDAAITSKLAHVAEVVCPGPLAGKIRALPPGADQVLRAVDLLKPRLANTRTLLVLDNLWERQAERQWASELKPMLSASSGSAVLVSTRSFDIAECADEGRRFSVGRLTDEEAAIRIIELHAGLKCGAAVPAGRAGSRFDMDDNSECEAVLGLMLSTCNGWHLALGMCGALIKLMGYRWAEIGRRLNHKLVTLPSSLASRGVQHDGLRAIVDTNLEAAQDSLRDAISVGHFSTASDQHSVEGAGMTKLYSRLVVLSVGREFPFFVLGALFGLSDEGGKAVGMLLESAGLAKIKGSGNERVLLLHDLQYACAEQLCKEAGVPVASVHSEFLSSCAQHLSSGKMLRPGECYDWSKACELAGAKAGPEEYSLAVYLCNNLVRHLVESSRDERGAVLIEMKRDDNGVWKAESACVGAVCSYAWIRERGHRFGRASILRDFGLLRAAFDTGSGEASDSSVNEQLARQGIWHALHVIYDVLLRIDSVRYDQGDGSGDPDCTSTAHTKRDSGLAGELYGRLDVLEFQRVDSSARPYALQVVAMMQASIRASARPPWLCPRSACYGSVERKDERCVLEFEAGERDIYGVAYVQIGGEMLLMSGGRDWTVRVHDTRLSGRAVREMSEHVNYVADVAVVGRETGRADGDVLAASCSLDGTVRFWSAGSGGDEEQRCLKTLESSSGEDLGCLALTPGAARVVAGGYGGISRNGEDEGETASAAPPEHVEFCVVHVWTHRPAVAGALPAEPSASEYAAIALPGHTNTVLAVQVSRDGERIVSGSEDGTVRFWHVPMDAAPAAGVGGAAVAPRVVDCALDENGVRSENYKFCVTALALTADGRTVYAGTNDYRNGGSYIKAIDCDSVEAAVEPLRSDKVVAAVSCLALLEADSGSGGGSGGGGGSSNSSGRLFAGHVDGIISEWDLGSRSCSAVYGDSQSGAGWVQSIAARFVVEQRSEGGVGLDGAPVAASGLGATGAGDRVEHVRDGDDAGAGGELGGVEFATGYGNGLVRVWRAAGSCGSRKNSLLPPGDTLDEAAAGRAGGDKRAPERHVDIPGDTPSCLAASRDGRWLVSGSFKGILCVWNVETGKCVATLRGHGSACIIGIDVGDDGKVIATCSDDKTARVWSSRGSSEWTSVAVLEHESRVNCVILTANTAHAITGDVKGGVRVWDAQTGEICGRLRAGHSQQITSLAVLRQDAAVPGVSRSRTASRSVATLVRSAVRRQRRKNAAQFASRDADGKCILWSMSGDASVSIAEDVPFDKDLGTVFSSIAPATPRNWWHERRFWWVDRRLTFVLSRRGGQGGVQRYEVARDKALMRRLTVRLVVDCEPDTCSCFSGVKLDSTIQDSTYLACERRQDGGVHVIACCGLFDGTVAMFDAIDSAPPS